MRKAASAGLWSALDLFFRQGVQFGVSIVLARLLTPSDFGVIALTSFFATLSTVFVQGGLMVALIQRQDIGAVEESSIFWLNLIASTLLAGVVVAIAPLVAGYYDRPVLRPLLWLAAAQIVIAALGAVHGTLLIRDLRFRQLATVGLAASLISGAIGIAAALLGAGVWALGLQILFAAIMTTAGTWWANDWRPRAILSIGSIRPLLGFGAWLSLSNLLDVIYTQGFSLLIAKLHGLRAVGLYTRAANTQALPSNILFMIIARVALPLFSAKASDPAALRRGARLAVGIPMLLNVPVMLGLVLLSDPIIRVLFGAQWTAAAPILSILAVAGLLLPLNAINLQILLALGGSATYFRVETVKKLAAIACVVVGSFYGIEGLAASQIVASVLAFLLGARPVSRRLQYPVRRQLADLIGIFLPGAAMFGAILLLKPFASADPIAALAFLVPVGALVYAVAGFGTRSFAFVETANLAMPMIGRMFGRASPFRGV